MRDTRPGWIRWIGYVALAAVLWWVTAAFSPDPGKIEELSFAKLARAIAEDGLKPHRAEGEDALVVADLKTAWGPGCQVGWERLLGRRVKVDDSGRGTLTIDCGREESSVWMKVRLERPGEEPATFSEQARVPSGSSLWPPLIAVLLALMTKRVLLSLLTAIVMGALLAADGAIGDALGNTVTRYLWSNTSDFFNLYIFGFTLVLIGTVHVCIAMGGMQGVINLLTRAARTVRSTQLTTALMGLAVFFDDYANSVIVGSSARPLTDAQRISREKLAYIVDSTAAPVAGLAIISTWIGYEIGLFDAEMDSISHIASSGYDFFFEILPYRFYCIFAVVFVFLVAVTGRDFGPMYKAELRARKTGQVSPRETRTLTGAKLPDTAPKPGVPARWFNGLIPIAVVLAGTFGAFMVIGRARILDAGGEFSWTSLSSIGDAFSAVGDDNVLVLFWAAVTGAVLALGMALLQRLLTVREAFTAFTRGVRSMLPAIAILILAIGIRQVTVDLGTERYLAATLTHVPLWILPLATFLLAAAVAFATGTSWGTMGIILPVGLPLAAGLVGDTGQDVIILLVAASVLDGAIFGDHCSLISDTSVMSSMACSCDHVEHVRTQIPYATICMLVAGSAGYLLVAQQWDAVPVVVCYAVGIAALWGYLRLRGRNSNDDAAPS